MFSFKTLSKIKENNVSLLNKHKELVRSFWTTTIYNDDGKIPTENKTTSLKDGSLELRILAPGYGNNDLTARVINGILKIESKDGKFKYLKDIHMYDIQKISIKHGVLSIHLSNKPEPLDIVNIDIEQAIDNVPDTIPLNSLI